MHIFFLKNRYLLVFTPQKSTNTANQGFPSRELAVKHLTALTG